MIGRFFSLSLGRPVMPDSQLFNSLFLTQNFASPNILFVFGIFLTLGVLGAIMAHHVRWLPTITAFMILGVVIGPGGIGLIDSSLLAQSSVLIDVALGLILYKLGCDVQLRHLLRTTTIWRVAVMEAFFTFGAVFIGMTFLGSTPLVSALVAAIAVSSSPAVLVHMADEMQARGPVIYQAKGLLTLNNISSFIAFSLFLPFALGEESFSWIDMIAIPLYRTAGAMGVGAFVAYLMSQIDRHLDKEYEHFRFALIIGGITVTLGLTSMLQISSLFAALTLGVVTRWLDKQRQGLSTIDFGSSSDVFFIVLFVMAGANLHITEFWAAGVAALVLSLARGFAKTTTFLLNHDTEVHDRKSIFAISLMLTPMGALAIGLAQTLFSFSPSIGGKVLPIIFAMVALLETFGPFAVSKAIRMTGESPLYRKAPAPEEPKEEASETTPDIKTEADTPIV